MILAKFGMLGEHCYKIKSCKIKYRDGLYENKNICEYSTIIKNEDSSVKLVYYRLIWEKSVNFCALLFRRT